MSCFKFGKIEIASKNFCKQKRVPGISTTDLNKVLVSDKVSWNNGKDWRYTVGCQVDGKTYRLLSRYQIVLLAKVNRTIRQSHYNKNSAYTKSFNVYEIPEWVLHFTSKHLKWGSVAVIWKAENSAYNRRR